MKKVSYVVGLAGMVPAAAALMAPAAANGAAAPSQAPSRDAAAAVKASAPAGTRTVNLHHVTTEDLFNGVSGYASVIRGPATLYLHSGDVTVYDGDLLYVQCYYLGAPYPDPDWDHVTREYSIDGHYGPWSGIGHIADSFINFSGLTASQAGVTKCG
jgi:hypothetical protein